MKNSKILFTLAALVLILLLEYCYRDTLYEKSLLDAPHMQKKKKLFGFFAHISALGRFPVHLFILVVVFNVVSKPAALYIWSAYSVQGLCKHTLKSWYEQPRPFYVVDNISPEHCMTDFGNPSGHMVSNVFLILTLYLHKYYEVDVAQERMSVFCTAYIIKMAATAAGMVFLIFMGFSRVYLGAHTYNQVLFGAMIGAYLAFVGHFAFKRAFLNLPLSLINNDIG